MDLLKLLDLAKIRKTDGVAPVAVRGVTCDSRRVRPGDLFVAVPGARADGGVFAGEAVAAGAVAVICEAPLALPRDVPVITVSDARRALARLAAAAEGQPARALTMIGVTGTNGKTTTTHLVEGALRAHGGRPGVIGTIAHRFGSTVREAGNTTPGPEELHGLLREMVENGATAAVMEVSSHALAQGRVDGIRFDAAVFTNLTRDHLDYHVTEARYLDAKAELFRMLPASGVAVLNRDDDASEILAAETRGHVLWYGLRRGGDLSGEIQRADESGMTLLVRTPMDRVLLRTRLVGAHNASNILGALGAALAVGVPLETAARGIAGIERVSGRLERVELPAPFSVFVDYAHTEDALSRVLTHLRAVTAGRLVVVFGCGGDRDRGKRPRMAAVAECLADRVVVTSDNPRSEDPLAIIGEILGGISRRDSVLVEPDRRMAIARALALLEPGDTLLIAGKGHENCQIVGTERLPFDDRRIAAEAFGSAETGA